MAGIHIGPAGWSYPDWKGVVYPNRRPGTFHELPYIAQYFNLVEINSSFYRIPPRAHIKSWLEHVRDFDDFRFAVKMWQGFTHAEGISSAEHVRAVADILEPIANAERLGALLVQFPWRYKKSRETVQHLEWMLKKFSAFPCAVEFRHVSWNDTDVLELLRNHTAAFVNIDQPVIGRSIPPTSHVTAPFAYLRLHGRNYETWFQEDVGRNARYNYLYPPKEMHQLGGLVTELNEKAETTYVVFNNHFRGQAVVNGFQLLFEITKKPQHVPPELMQTYPELRSIARELPGRTMDLF